MSKPESDRGHWQAAAKGRHSTPKCPLKPVATDTPPDRRGRGLRRATRGLGRWVRSPSQGSGQQANGRVVDFVYDGTNWVMTLPSFVEGYYTTASGDYAHAEGYYTNAYGSFGAHAEGYGTEASGDGSHAEGTNTIASGRNSHAEGYQTTASASSAHASGEHTIANQMYQFVIGRYNNTQKNTGYGTCGFVMGKGNSESSRANAFRVADSGVFAAGNYNSSGADYAELFEWLDGNPNHEDRCGRFVTLEGEKIRIAGPGDSFILGIVSGNPSVVGDVYDDQWQGMYLYDIFGRPLYEDVEVPDELGPDGEVLIPAHMEHRQKLNPAYDHTQPYQPRSQRPEWDAVGMLGKLVMVDDGTCQINGWCTVGDGGAATRSEVPSNYRVMARLDACHVRVMIL